jgi:VanZ family protein
LLLWRAIRKTRGEKLGQPVEAYRQQSEKSLWKWQEAGLALSVVFLYAATDEFHQIFVPNRSPMFSDVCIDTCGGAVALIALWIFIYCRENVGKPA